MYRICQLHRIYTFALRKQRRPPLCERRWLFLSCEVAKQRCHSNNWTASCSILLIFWNIMFRMSWQSSWNFCQRKFVSVRMWRWLLPPLRRICCVSRRISAWCGSRRIRPYWLISAVGCGVGIVHIIIVTAARGCGSVARWCFQRRTLTSSLV